MPFFRLYPCKSALTATFRLASQGPSGPRAMRATLARNFPSARIYRSISLRFIQYNQLINKEKAHSQSEMAAKRSFLSIENRLNTQFSRLPDMLLTDITPYRKYVDHYDISEEQKVQLIHTIWDIMQSVVDEAFGKHPVQLAKEGSGKPLQNQKAELLSFSERKRSGVSKLR